MALLFGGRDVTVQVSFVSKASNSLSIASFNLLFLEAWVYVLGSVILLIMLMRCLFVGEVMLL